MYSLAQRVAAVIVLCSLVCSASPLYRAQGEDSQGKQLKSTKEVSLIQEFTRLLAAQDTKKFKEKLHTLVQQQRAASAGDEATSEEAAKFLSRILKVSKADSREKISASQSHHGSHKVERSGIQELRKFFGKIGRRILSQSNQNYNEQTLEQASNSTNTSPTTSTIPSTVAPTTVPISAPTTVPISVPTTSVPTTVPISVPTTVPVSVPTTVPISAPTSVRIEPTTSSSISTGSTATMPQYTLPPSSNETVPTSAVTTEVVAFPRNATTTQAPLGNGNDLLKLILKLLKKLSRPPQRLPVIPLLKKLLPNIYPLLKNVLPNIFPTQVTTPPPYQRLFKDLLPDIFPPQATTPPPYQSLFDDLLPDGFPPQGAIPPSYRDPSPPFKDPTKFMPSSFFSFFKRHKPKPKFHFGWEKDKND